EPSGRTRFLDDDERARLLEARKTSGSPYLPLLVLIAMATGMGLNEIVLLTSKRMSLKENSIILHRAKNDAPRRVPIPGRALTGLEARAESRRIETDRVFPIPNTAQKPTGIRSAWLVAVKRAKFKKYLFCGQSRRCQR
ncbi:MAG: tyrosine-type recombinase/integrase, partial [Bdellovibrionales bacterium]|nr:tyrosine-type recombinase/integrase [Bdellovibrionales bacterium]